MSILIGNVLMLYRVRPPLRLRALALLNYLLSLSLVEVTLVSQTFDLSYLSLLQRFLREVDVSGGFVVEGLQMCETFRELFG